MISLLESILILTPGYSSISALCQWRARTAEQIYPSPWKAYWTTECVNINSSWLAVVSSPNVQSPRQDARLLSIHRQDLNSKPTSSHQGAVSFLYQHCRGIYSILKTNIEFFTTLKTKADIITGVSKYYNHIITKGGRLFKRILH